MAQPGINTSDELLLEQYRNSGDNHYLGLLLQRYTLMLLGVAMKYLKDKEQSQDAVQFVFLKALTHLPKGEILNFKGWLYVLMRNHCLQLLRDKNYEAGAEALSYIEASETDHEELKWYDYTLDQMTEALQDLADEQRNCIVFFYLQKKSYQQIMEQTGFSFTQVKSYIQNGKRNLKLTLLRKLQR